MLDCGERLFLKFFVRFASLLLRKITFKQFLTQKKKVSYPKCI